MKKLLVIFALFFSNTVLAATYSAETNYSSEEATLNIRRHVLSVMPTNIGVSVMNTEYTSSTNQQKWYANGIMFSTVPSGLKVNQVTFTGRLGLGQQESNNYMVGDMNANYRINSTLSANVGVYGDLLDTPAALSRGINYRGVHGNIDFDKNSYGVVLGVRNVRMSDGNVQNGQYGRAWIKLIDGFNGYVAARHHTNSLSDNGVYFSPEHYLRQTGGVSFRTSYVINDSKLLVTGFIERGRIRLPSSSEDLTAWRLQGEYPLNNVVTLVLNGGQDAGMVSRFRYRYANLGVRIIY